MAELSVEIEERELHHVACRRRNQPGTAHVVEIRACQGHANGRVVAIHQHRSTAVVGFEPHLYGEPLAHGVAAVGNSPNHEHSIAVRRLHHGCCVCEWICERGECAAQPVVVDTAADSGGAHLVHAQHGQIRGRIKVDKVQYYNHASRNGESPRAVAGREDGR